MRKLAILCSLILALAATGSHAADKKNEVATFAGGCFWCMQGPFDDVEGVKSTMVGYTGGTEKNPTYQEVGAHKTGHCEAIQVEYDPSKVTYEQLLWVYWHNIDPTAGDHQFCDYGPQYRPEIFYHNDEQRALAEASRAKVEEKFGTVAVRIEPAVTFWPAEEYHQQYYVKSSEQYHAYRKGCGRDRRLEELWGDEAGH